MTAVPLYRRKAAAPDRRAADLVRRMTLEEKAAQLYAVFKQSVLARDAEGREVLDADHIRRQFPHGLGRICAPMHTATLREGPRQANEIQRVFLGNSRFGIPVLFDCEALHGCMAPGSTSYPQAIALAATWNPTLLEQIATAIGREVRAWASHQVLSPVLDIARDVRAGRTEETYGEDPFLVSRLGVAYIRGIQSQRIVTTPKHYLANFVGDGGRDSYPIHFTERHLREVYLPPYEAAVREAGALSIMSAYHSYEGSPCSANAWLLRTVLKKEFGFKGAVTSDWGAVPHLQEFHRIARNPAETAELAIKGGLDVECPMNLGFQHLPALVRKGRVSLAILDEAVRRALYLKFWTGLFDSPYVDEQQAAIVVNNAPHRALALEAAREGIVLLRNDGVLPLSKKARTVAVIGPNADTGRLGGYSAPGLTPVSPLDGIRRAVSPGTRVAFAPGCGIMTSDRRGIRKAVALARRADTVVLCMGNVAFVTEGEGMDRCNLDLPGVQEDLILAVANANPNVVVVLIGGSAVTMQRWLNKVRAVVVGWYPGQEGGTALAEILFGDRSPGGKLPITFPRTTGQCPLYYNPKPSGRKYDYIDLRGVQEQFAFGHGLSYTTFDYRDLRVRKSGAGRRLSYRVSVGVRNAGRRAGDEVVQLYIRDLHSRLSRPILELKGFQRVNLRPGQRTTVRFTLNWRDLAYLGEDLKPTLDPGPIEFMVGSSSADIRLRWGNVPDPHAEARYNDLSGYEVSGLLPPVSDIRQAPYPPARLSYDPATQFFTDGMFLTNISSAHDMKHGLLYIRVNVPMSRGGKGQLCYGSDGPVKAWVNGKVVDSRPAASNPIVRGEYVAPATWKTGVNRIVFALSSNHGKAWGVTAFVRGGQRLR